MCYSFQIATAVAQEAKTVIAQLKLVGGQAWLEAKTQLASLTAAAKSALTPLLQEATSIWNSIKHFFSFGSKNDTLTTYRVFSGKD